MGRLFPCHQGPALSICAPSCHLLSRLINQQEQEALEGTVTDKGGQGFQWGSMAHSVLGLWVPGPLQPFPSLFSVLDLCLPLTRAGACPLPRPTPPQPGPSLYYKHPLGHPATTFALTVFFLKISVDESHTHFLQTLRTTPPLFLPSPGSRWLGSVALHRCGAGLSLAPGRLRGFLRTFK